MAATRIDYKRELAELYSPGAAAGIVDVPELAFLMVDGHGDPNTAVEYREAVEALFAVSYAAKFALKRAPEAVDFAVMPLEGLWWVPDMSTFSTGDKSDWSWTAMIMQPDLVTAEVVDAATHKSAAKKSLPALDLLRFERFHEGLAAQVSTAARTPTRDRPSPCCTSSSPITDTGRSASIMRSTSAIPAARRQRS